MGPLWHGEPHHLLDRLNPDQSIRNGGDVIEPVPVRRDHRVHPILGDLLHAAMEITNVTIEIDYRLAIELENDTQHPVSGRMGRSH